MKTNDKEILTINLNSRDKHWVKHLHGIIINNTMQVDGVNVMRQRYKVFDYQYMVVNDKNASHSSSDKKHHHKFEQR